MTECLFCKIASKDIPAEIVYEDGSTVAFLDVNPRAPGHTMIIPKSHAANILELHDQEITPLFSSVKKTVKLLSSALEPDGFTIGINHGEASGQAVEHIHVHVIPRFLDDGGISIHGVVNNKPKESLKDIAQKIKSKNG